MTKKGGKKVKKAVIFPILTALLAVTVIGTIFLEPYFIFYYYTAKALMVSSRKITFTHYQQGCLIPNDTRYFPNEIILPHKMNNDLGVEYSSVYLDKFEGYFGCSHYKKKESAEFFVRSRRLEGNTIAAISVNGPEAPDEENPYILRLYMIKSKCLINVVTGFEDYSEAENAAKYFGVDLPPRSDIVYGEFFVID